MDDASELTEKEYERGTKLVTLVRKAVFPALHALDFAVL